MNGEQQLGIRVILRAFIDATSDNICEQDMINARNFLLADKPWWKESLETWCLVAGISMQKVRKKAHELWGNE